LTDLFKKKANSKNYCHTLALRGIFTGIENISFVISVNDDVLEDISKLPGQCKFCFRVSAYRLVSEVANSLNRTKLYCCFHQYEMIEKWLTTVTFYCPHEN